jgi:cell wall-associated NlpC family hydrolase
VTSNPQLGDLVTWGSSRVTHIGIFAGRDSAGRPLTYSALTNGVMSHRVTALGKPLKAYLRVNLSR